MSILIRNVLQWLGSKFVTLLAIMGILLAANWGRSEWAEITKLLNEKSTLDLQIAERQKYSEALLAEAEEMGKAAHQSLAKIRSLDDAARVAKEKYDTAHEYWKECKAKVSFFDPTSHLNERTASGLSTTAWNVYEAAKKAADLARTEQEKENLPLALNQAKTDAERKQLDQLEKERKEVVEKTAQTPGRRFFLAVREVLSSALWILAGVILVPILIKAVLFFVVAPLADKVAPIKIEPGDGKSEEPRLLASGVSLNVEISGDDELLAHADYLQSSAKSAQKLTKWFLNHRLPFSSSLSGMWLLTRVRAKEGERETIRISPTRDPLGELALIELPAGTSMVLYPRSLAAVIKPRGQEISIQSRWRLKSLHGWLTLQFRYLVFHGPCKVVVKGCRGVCVEKPVPGKPRLISQSATIGFSGNIDYSNTRSEVFISYFRGKDDLFNDLFGGSEGVFVYEEMPDMMRKTGLTGRGIEGITDAFLKAFGV